MSTRTKILSWILVILVGMGLLSVATSDAYDFPEVYLGISG